MNRQIDSVSPHESFVHRNSFRNAASQLWISHCRSHFRGLHNGVSSVLQIPYFENQQWMQASVNERRSESQYSKECTEAFLADEEAVLEATSSDFKDIISSYKRLWETDAYKKLWERHSKIHLPAFFPYFIERLDTISEPNYLATNDDILHVRLRTTGVQVVDDMEYRPCTILIFPSHNIAVCELG